jgi:AraC-like DNA-binding protein
MIVPPDCVHVSAAVSTETVQRYCFHFDWTYSPRSKPMPYCVFLPGRLEKSGVRMAPGWVLRTFWFGRIPHSLAAVQLAKKICERWSGPDCAERSACRALLLELLVQLLEEPARRTRPRDRQGDLAGRVKQLLDQRYTPRDSIQSLLEELDFSYEHLCRIFRKQFGVSPLSYVNSVRVERAKALLKQGGKSVKAVAAETGFDDAAYFSRLFRKTTGVSPAVFAADANTNSTRPLRVK